MELCQAEGSGKRNTDFLKSAGSGNYLVNIYFSCYLNLLKDNSLLNKNSKVWGKN